MPEPAMLVIIKVNDTLPDSSEIVEVFPPQLCPDMVKSKKKSRLA